MAITIPPNSVEPNQGSACQECSVIKPLMASAAECETATLFINCQTAIVMRATAMELGHEQPATPVQVDNATTFNYVRGTLQQKCSKSFDVRLHWLRDRTNREQFYVCWEKGMQTWQLIIQNITHRNFIKSYDPCTYWLT